MTTSAFTKIKYIMHKIQDSFQKNYSRSFL